MIVTHDQLVLVNISEFSKKAASLEQNTNGERSSLQDVTFSLNQVNVIDTKSLNEELNAEIAAVEISSENLIIVTGYRSPLAVPIFFFKNSQN
jgi:hypothetical protein